MRGSIEREQQCLAILADRARRGLPCPTNDNLCSLLGYESPGATSRIIKQLEAKGLIRVERGQTARVVTILESGERTAGEVGQAHWRQLKAPTPRKPIDRSQRQERAAEMMARPRVDRDPCPRCGVRGDIGCSHSKAPVGWFVGGSA